LLIQNFCIPPADFLISFGFGLGRVVRVPPGDVGILVVVVVVVVGVDGPLTAEVGLVSGDTVVIVAVAAATITSGGATNSPPVALANERRIAICFDRLALSSKVYLHARIASGTDDRGHLNKKVTVCAMRTSTRRPLPDMFEKIFGQSYTGLDGRWTSIC
jgi:hypothetical protein